MKEHMISTRKARSQVCATARSLACTIVRCRNLAVCLTLVVTALPAKLDATGDTNASAELDPARAARTASTTDLNIFLGSFTAQTTTVLSEAE